MKKILIYSLALGLILPMFNGCKKGADDPGLSLRSRDARIKGKWELVEVVETHDIDNSNITNNIKKSTLQKTDISYSNGKLQTSTLFTFKDPDKTTYLYSKNVADYKLEVEILKDNSSNVKETNTESEYCTDTLNTCVTQKVDNPETNTNAYVSNWYWLDSKKNKIAIFGPHQYFTGNIRRLSKEEIIFESVETSENEEKTTTGTKSNKTTITKTYTFKKI